MEEKKGSKMRKWIREEQWGDMLMLAICYLAGVCAGALFANLAYPWRTGRGDFLGLAMLADGNKEIRDLRRYLLYLLERRMRIFLFFLLSGLTSAVRAAAAGGMILMGILAGAASGFVLLEAGGEGFAAWTAGNMPQALFYGAALLVLLSAGCETGGRIWKRKNYQKRYLLSACFSLLLTLLGVAAEACLQPMILAQVGKWVR